MKLYNLNGEDLSLIESKSFDKEKEIQFLIQKNSENLFNLKFISSEFKLDNFRIDSLCYDEESKSFVIIEYKKDYSFSIIDQGYSYLSLILHKKFETLEKYNEVFGTNLKINEVDWTQTRIIFISPFFTLHQKNSINFKDLPFELWEIKKYSNDLISLNPILSNSNQNLNNRSKNPTITNVNKEIKVYNLKKLLKNTSKITKILWEKIDHKLIPSEFIGTKYIDRKSYRRFCYENHTTICYFRFRKNSIRIRITGGTIFGDGSKGKTYIELNDYKNLTKKVEKIWEGYEERHGNRDGTDAKNYFYEIEIGDDNNIDYLIQLLKQRYESIVKN